MASDLDQPLVRVSLRPLQEVFSAGPAPVRLLRFVLWLGWPQAPQPASQAEPSLAVGIALVSPELPYSVLPLSVRQRSRIAVPDDTPEGWRGRPVPTWRGIPCRAAVVPIRIRNEMAQDATIDLPVLFLLPEQEPAGPPLRYALLGAQFFNHYGMRLTLDYSALRYNPAPDTGRSTLDMLAPCGRLEIP